jgi:hypothetical protein
MRLIFAAAIVALLTHGASAQESSSTNDPTAAPKAEMSAEAEFMMKLHEFANKMEEAGFKDVQISHALVLKAKDKSDKPVTLLVDPTTMTGVELNTSPDRETTGSGSTDDDDDE